jgi:cold shock CspA family protein
MQLPLQIAYRNMEPSPQLDETIRREATGLDRFCDHIMGCRVVVDVPHRHHLHGNQYHVRLDITVPGDELIINREPAEHVSSRSLERSIREAFDTAVRLLEDYVRKQRGLVKAHAQPAAHARVRVVMHGQDHGFLETFDGREIYFHKHALAGSDFEQLQPGTEVTFVEELGEKGPQATTVRIVGRHHQLTA